MSKKRKKHPLAERYVLVTQTEGVIMVQEIIYSIEGKTKNRKEKAAGPQSAEGNKQEKRKRIVK
jgi:hypothetical protein